MAGRGRPRIIDVEKAVKLRSHGVKLEAIAAEFGVTRSSVHAVCVKHFGHMARRPKREPKHG